LLAKGKLTAALGFYVLEPMLGVTAFTIGILIGKNIPLPPA
jgi:hypothetical protein